MKVDKEQLLHAFRSIGFLPEATKVSNNREGETLVVASFDFIKDNPFSIHSSLEYLTLFTKLKLGFAQHSRSPVCPYIRLSNTVTL